MYFKILESSSAGNCAFLQSGKTKILIDAGVGITKIKTYLAARNLSISDIDAIFITHEHVDHCGSLKSFCACENLSVFANADTAESIRYIYPNTKSLKWRIFEDGYCFEFGDLLVTPFHLPHDTNDCVGYSIKCAGEELVWATDLGMATKVLLDVVSRASVLILESNYCPIMLDNSSRPYRLKSRISSRNGHLSNADAIGVLKTLNPNVIKKIFLAHVSSECNRAEHILELLQACEELAPILKKIEIVLPRSANSSAIEF